MPDHLLMTKVSLPRFIWVEEAEGYSLSRIMGKLSKVLESLAFVLLGLLFGYINGENPGRQPENAFRFLMSVFPLVFIFIAWLIASRLPFENEQSTPHMG
jgi:GPH family glycoside/pentoside/hexuronide:cation symporter